MKQLMLRAVLKRHRILCLAMLLIIVLNVGLLVGAVSFDDSLNRALTDYVRDYGCADAVVSVNAAYRTTVQRLREIPGVADANARIFLDTAIRTADGEHVAVRTYSYSSNDFSDFHYWARSENRTGYYLDYRFAEAYGIRAGDTVQLRLGADYETVQISAIVSTPETLGRRNADGWAAAPTFGYLYYGASVLNRTGVSELCNQFLLRFSEASDPDETLRAVCACLEGEGLTVTEAYTFADSPVNAVIRDNVDPVSVMCVTVPSIFFLIVLGVLLLCMSVLVRQSRSQIGLLRALGYRKGEIIRLFCLLMLLVCAAGSLLGLPIAWVLLRVLCNYYRDFFPLPALPCRFDASAAAIGIAATLLLPQLTTVLSCASVSSVQPTEILRSAVPAGRALPMRFLPRAKPLTKFMLAALLRSPKRLVFTVLCLAATVTVSFSALSYRASCFHSVDQLFGERLHFDALAYFGSPIGEDTAELLCAADGVSAVERCVYATCEITFADRAFNAAITAAPAGSAFLSIPDVGSIPAEGIVLEQYAAEVLGVSAGDTVCVDGSPFVVSAISRQATSRSQYLSLEQLSRTGAGDYEALMIRAEDEAALRAVCAEADGFLFLSMVSDLHADASELFRSFLFIVRVLLLFSALVSFVIVLIAARTAVSERKRELCILRTQGFSFGAISANWLLQSLIQYVLGCLIGFPVGSLTAKLILARIYTERRAFFYASGPAEYLLTGGLLFVCFFAGHTAALSAVRRWNLAAALKSDE